MHKPATPNRSSPPSPPVADGCNNSVGNSNLLAPWTYQNEEFFGLEIEYLFKQNWLLVGHVSDIPEPRDYLTFDAVGEQALVLRGNDNEIRAFHNICRHRGAKILDPARGQCPHALTCPFHGWTYHLDGRLASVPAEPTFSNLNKDENGLMPLPFEIWMGFIFVRFCEPVQNAKHSSVAEIMQPVEALLAPYQMSQMKPLANTRFHAVRPYNWKTIHDIDNEGYHVPIGHPALQQLYGKNYRDDALANVPVSYAYLNEKPGKLWSVRHYQNLLPSYDHLPEDQRRLWLYVGIFPSMVLALYPDSMEFYMTIPLTTESSRFISSSYALPDERRETRAAQYLSMRINRTTDREDESFVRRLQTGMKSSAFPTPHLSSIEQNVRRFHQKIQHALPVATLANAPSSNTVAQVNQEMKSAR